MKLFTKTKRVLASAVAAMLAVATVGAPNAWADVDESTMSGFSMSPMNQKLVLDPGESYTASVSIFNPGTHIKDITYTVSVAPFYVNDEYTTVFENVDGLGQMADWITLLSPDTGTLSPNSGTDIYFRIDVPWDAPAGGQYASIKVASGIASDADSGSSEGSTMMINQVTEIGHLVFAEITGDTIRKGEIVEMDVPSLVMNGDITAYASIKNTGNTHGTATYKLQIFPLFSNEEVYTNVENPETRTILPNRVLYSESVWQATPTVGIFNVVYTVEFEGITATTTKLVIKCPTGILFSVIFAILIIIFWLVYMARKRKSNKK